jgi:FkbM family methyltransferase
MKECKSIQLRHSDVVVDIGAYVGTYAITAARFPVKKVIAYEPTPVTFEVLSKTKLRNLELHQAAIVGDASIKEVNLFISAGIGVTNSIVLSRRKKAAITVSAVSYAEAVKEATIVKIDVEGAEYSYPIVQPGLRAIILDIHETPGDWMSAADRIIEEIQDHGFRPVVKPNWSCGWTCAGSWIRDRDTHGEHEQLMRGEFCIGCGVVTKADSKCLCTSCWNVWQPKHRAGFVLSKL